MLKKKRILRSNGLIKYCNPLLANSKNNNAFTKIIPIALLNKKNVLKLDCFLSFYDRSVKNELRRKLSRKLIQRADSEKYLI